MKRTRLRLSVSLILAFLVAMAAISSAPPVFTQQSHPLLTGTLWLDVPATISESDGSVSYTVLMVSEEDQQPSANARLSVNVSSSNDVAYAPHDFAAVDDDFTFIASDFTRVETLHGSGTYRYVATATGQVTLIDDPLIESDESFTLTLSTTTATEATIATATHRVVIEDDDNYGLAVSVDTVSIVEGQTDDITVTASVTPEADSCVVGFPIILDIQLSGSATATDDYTHDFGDGGSTLSSIRIPPCADSVEWTMSFAAVLDMSSDPGETIVLTAVDRTGGSALETPSTTTSATVEIQDALAGRFVDSTIPEWHNGTSEFTTQIAFSEDINTSVTDFRHYSLIVTAGDIRNVSLVDNRKDLWEITIKPIGNVDVTVALHTVQGCNTNGAICTADDKQLSNHVETRVRSDASFPTDLRVISVETDSVELSWEPPEYPEWRTLTGYHLHRLEINEQNTPINETQVRFDVPLPDSQDTSTTVRFADFTVEPETTYRYWLNALYIIDGLTVRSDLAPTIDVTTAPLLMRVPPTDFRVTDVTHQRAVLRWTAPQVPEGQVLTGYQITRTGGGAERSTDLSATNISYSASSLDSNTVYEFTLRARYSDRGLQGGLSDGVSAITTTLTVPLTAEFQNAPDSHTGSGFIFRVLFSEAISSSYTTLRDHSFVVTNGSVTRARRLDKRSDYWEITVTPDSNEDVTIGLQANLACDADGAICAGNKRLSSGPEVTVSGRVTVDS